ncbi:oxygenase MpaB family protein [Aspergillus saccharolyticus JOP 1030-1]|uniref:ER-bound oxygenase mpaB/mpaB'/Rubber oxygenase catalytic domain-containing protein n=1 Tax=Aspergillus saccharolyticus JOP 1030-1 TaxID=1450539 RepID=A0A318ZNQ2_9EURO|nr:hypothetical protein BP01DRAFT_289565 [Aspergillus saccharolyticus JOP 1030-1]PYH48607.1 hypothetical protein BP01DRAFT_289565 [Aspergillus saccharolyticus JOP 1030-1]
MNTNEKAISEHIFAVPSTSSSSSTTNDITLTTTITSITTLTTPFHDLSNLTILPQILREGILFTGVGAALLLQAAYPGIQSAFPYDSHHTLTHNLTSTLQTTLQHIAVLVFGTPQERPILLTRLHAGPGNSHRQITPPQTRLWIAATIYATATDLYERTYGCTDHRSAERAYEEFTVVLTALGLVEAALWPPSRREFWEYWDGQVARLAVTAEAHRVAKEVLAAGDQSMVVRGMFPKGWAKVLRPVVRALTIELLPLAVREAYGLRSSGATRGWYRGVMAGFGRGVYPAMPGWVRQYPLRVCLGRWREGVDYR